MLCTLIGHSVDIKWDKPILCGTDCRSLTRDSKNNFYFSGQINNSIANEKYFGNINLPLYTQYYNYGFIAKTDKNYKSKWIKIFESDAFFEPIIRIDSKDNLVLLALFHTNLKIGSYEFVVPEKKQVMLVAKFDSTGNMLWNNTIIGGIGGMMDQDLKIDNEDNIYIAGEDIGMTTFTRNNQIDTIIGNNDRHIFFAKFHSDGQFEWAKSLPEGHNLIILKSMEIDKNKNIYLTGWWDDGGTFDGIPKISKSSDIFIAKYDSQQKLKWLKQLCVPSNTIIQSGNALAIDEKLNSIYVTGGFLGSVDFGGKIVQASDNNIFLARYSLEGNLVWVKNMGSWSGLSSFIEMGYKLLVDNESSVYLSGVFNGNGKFDDITISAYNNPLYSNLENDFFIAKFKPTGQLLWVTHAGSPDDQDIVNDLFKDNENNLFVVGNTIQGAIFGDNIITAPYTVGFISKIMEQPVNFLNLSTQNLTFNATQNLTKSFEVFSDLNWQLSIDAPWLSASSSIGSNNGVVTLSAEINTISQERMAIVKISSSNGIEKIINIRQGAGLISKAKTMTDDAYFSTYPNPANNTIHFSSNYDLTNANITILDNKGRIIIQGLNKNNQLNIESLKRGIYIIIINNSKHQFVRSFIKD